MDYEAGMQDPEVPVAAIADLMHEHRNILRVVAHLDGLADGLGDVTDAELAVLREAVSFFREYADKRHHAKEEDHLFGMVAQSGGDHGIIEAMQAEHVEARQAVSAFEMAIEDYADDRDGANTALAVAIADLEALYTDHIAKEDEVVFPDMAAALEPDQLDALGRVFVKVDASMPDPATAFPLLAPLFVP
jgi:hemerythrin-like domain-containing protein